MGIDIYLSNHTIKKWFSSVIGDIALHYEYVLHSNLETLYSSLLNIKTKRLIILDIEDQISIEYFKSISSSFNNVYFIAIGINRPIPSILKLFSIGFKGFVDLNFSSIELYQLINKASIGSKYVSPLQQEQLLEYLVVNTETITENNLTKDFAPNIRHAIKALTSKENRVCELLIKGMTYKEIANAVGVTSYTINQRVKAIYKKLDVRSRGELSYRYLG